MIRMSVVGAVGSLSLAFETAIAQEVLFTDGTSLAGTVVSVDGSRAKVQCADGSTRSIDVRRIDLEIDEKGEEKRDAAALAKGPTTPQATALLARLAKGETLELPELVTLTENCTHRGPRPGRSPGPRFTRADISGRDG